MGEQDDPKLHELLKKSPTLTPPESFYRGVLREIDRRKNPSETKMPWYWGYPAKALVSACVLLVIVVATKETQKSNPEPLASPAPLSSTQSTGDQLANSKEVNSRLHRSITEYVGRPSPFEEIDAKEKQDLRAELGHADKAPAAAPASYPMQARDTVGGMATQDSFQRQEGVRAKDLPYNAVTSAPVPTSGSMASNFVPVSEMALAKKQRKGFEIAGPLSSRAILQEVLPIYSATEQDQGLVGTVRLYIIINPDGSVDSHVRVTKTSGYPALDLAAIDAVKKWKFSAAQETSWGIVTFPFPPNM